jgi:hypothetical protein
MIVFEIHDRTTDEFFYTDHEHNASAFYEDRAREYPTHEIVISRKEPDDVGEDAPDRLEHLPRGGPFVAAIRGGATGTIRKGGTYG